MKKTRVSIVRIHEQDTYAALNQAIDLIGNMAEMIPSGSSVLIKPNLVMCPTERGISNPVLLEAILKLVRSMSPKRIVIGEGSADSYTATTFRLHNVYDMASRYGATVTDFNVEQGVRINMPEAVGRDYVMLPQSMAEADVVISVPVFKLWMGNLPMSLSLKNLFGCYGARYYGHNKTSHELATSAPYRTLAGEVGSERGIHFPSVEQSIAAINLARTSDLTIVDALEGSDGKGNFVRMDMLIAGTNAVATDSVALAVAGFVPQEQKQIRLCSELGLGPCHLDEIDVLGETIADVQFDLGRLNGPGILGLPIAYCLDRLNIEELRMIGRGLVLNGFLSENTVFDTSRKVLTVTLLDVLEDESYLERALACLPESGRTVLALIKAHGGTSGDYFTILNAYTDQYQESNSFWAGLRSMMRLGLAYLFHGQHKTYVILAEGVK